MSSSDFAATEEIVKARLRQLDCTPAGNSLTATLYKTKDGVYFYVPKPFIGGFGYSIRQLDYIEQQLAPNGVDLLPLDYNIG